MRLPHGKLKALSEKSGIERTKLSAYANTHLRPGRKRALHLEKILGVGALLWLYGTSQEIKEALISPPKTDI